MPWIREIEQAMSLRTRIPFLEEAIRNVRGATKHLQLTQKKILHESHFKGEVFMVESRAQKEDQFLRGRQKLLT